jgi:hypothetical protein
MTARGLADQLGKSREGVRKAILRLKIRPLHILGRTRWFDPSSTLPLLEEQMRDYSKAPATHE